MDRQTDRWLEHAALFLQDGGTEAGSACRGLLVVVVLFVKALLTCPVLPINNPNVCQVVLEAVLTYLLWALCYGQGIYKEVRSLITNQVLVLMRDQACSVRIQ